MKLNYQILQTHPLLSLLPASTLQELMSDSALEEYPKGSVVFREGQICEAMYLVISGRCESRRLAGRIEQVDEVLGPGDTLGERELLNHEAYRSTITIATHSVLLRIPGEILSELFAARPSVAGKFSQSIAAGYHRDRQQRRIGRAQRLVALISLAPELHDLAIARRIASAIHALSQGKILLVHLVSLPQKASLQEWAAMDPNVNGEFRFRSELREHETYSELTLHAGCEGNEARHLASLLSHCSAHFDYVVLRVGAQIPVACALECLIQSDLAFTYLQAGSESLYHFRLLIREVDAQTRGHCTHIKPVICVEHSASATALALDLRHLGHPVHSFVRGYPIAGTSGGIDRLGNYAQHVRSLAREIARCRVGLALSSGGAKGLAHIGVIQVLEENGIEIDAVAGSSMGAYVAAVWGYGHDGGTCERIARQLESRWGLLRLFDPVLPPRQGFLKTRRAAGHLRRSIGRAHFSEMVRPLRVIATHLDTLERVVFSTGEVAQAVEASIAIPGICVPVTIDGEVFIDGGIADPLPVDVLHEMGLEQVIAVNTIPTPERLRHCHDVEEELAARHPRRFSVSHLLNKYLNYFARGNVLDTMLRSIHGVQTRVAESAGREADVLLQPWACDARWHDFTQPGKYIALGRKVAEDQLPQLKALTTTDEPASATLAVAHAH